MINDINYPTSRILEITLNIFELKEIVGYSKVLPIIGKVILDGLGLYQMKLFQLQNLSHF